MFHFDCTMVDSRVIANGDGTTFDVKLYDNHSGRYCDIVMNAEAFGRLLHTMLTDDGNGNSQFYDYCDDFLRTINVPAECRPIA